MHFISKFTLTLLVTLPSTLAAVNGKCSGRNGICISTSTCNSYGGTKYTQKCPNDASTVLCCDNISCTADDGRSGKCKFTSQCEGESVNGKCPGGSNFKCCVPRKKTTSTTSTSSSTSSKFKYFTIADLLKSDDAKKYHIDNTPTKEHLKNLEYLIANCLNPIREIYGKPIKVSSGYRSEALNKFENGSKTSQHMKGEAADLQPVSRKLSDLKALYRAIIKFNKYEQFILENDSWAHVSCSKHPKKHQILLKRKGKSGYEDITKNYKKYVS